MNMKVEYREELRILTRVQRKVRSDLKRFLRQNSQQLDILMRARNRAKSGVARELTRIERRIAILNGRLS